jgi:Cu/Ag efflux pump CusA
VSVHGKAGRAEIPTDLAPFSMMETVVQLARLGVAPEGALVLGLGPRVGVRTASCGAFAGTGSPGAASMIRNENGLLVGYVYVDITGRDVGDYVDDAKRAVAAAVKLPSSYALEWSGQYENMQRVTQRLKLVVPFALFLVLFLLYANTAPGS